MPFIAELLAVSFGKNQTGKAVGYRLAKKDGTDSVARTATGVVETSGGNYQVANVTIPDDAYLVEWDTGGGSPVYASEDLDPLRMQEEVQGKLPTNYIMGSGVQSDKDDEIDAILADTAAIDGRLPGSPAAVGSEMNLADDAITAAKHDESTSFPVKSDDSGATQLARTGADGDTLETLSDQIDGVPAAVDGVLTAAHGAGSWQSATSVDWSAAEREQIRDALGVDGTKTAAVGGQLQGKAEPGDAMTLTPAERQAIRTEIMSYVLEGNSPGYTTESTLQFIRKAARNRLEQADGDTDNLILYDDDAVTPFFQWDSVNKNGGPIDQPTAAPARRIPS